MFIPSNSLIFKYIKKLKDMSKFRMSPEDVTFYMAIGLCVFLFALYTITIVMQFIILLTQ